MPYLGGALTALRIISSNNKVSTSEETDTLDIILIALTIIFITSIIAIPFAACVLLTLLLIV